MSTEGKERPDKWELGKADKNRRKTLWVRKEMTGSKEYGGGKWTHCECKSGIKKKILGKEGQNE